MVLYRTIFFNKECWNALGGNEKAALDNLEQAIHYGWKKYEHTLTDPDLESLHDAKKFKTLTASIEKYSLAKLLKETKYAHGVYIPQVTYANPNDENLVKLRNYFNLDSIAGSGDELSKLKNRLYLVHDNMPHKGSSNYEGGKNAYDIYTYCRDNKTGVKCRMLAITLNEMYLAMGWKSRYVTCLSENADFDDCHVINAVYSQTLNKWIWMDPTFAAYVCDENGNLLSIDEVRQRLIDDEPLVLNEDANWNHKNQMNVDYYLKSYMTKNLYQLEIPTAYYFNQESGGVSTNERHDSTMWFPASFLVIQ